MSPSKLAPKFSCLYFVRQTVAVDRSDDGNFCHHVTIELVEVEQLPPVWGEPDVRVKMSTRFKLEGNDKFVAGDYVRSVGQNRSGRRVGVRPRNVVD